ncbi:MAG: PAS domain-containing protein [Elusimicrobia bacterium]|nr:PAS domain-containing protein [Elusimicrobiota bacterium]
MSEAPQAFERKCLEAIQGLGKALGQLSLYKLGHPAVAAMLAACGQQLKSLLSETPQGELAFSVDNDKLIVNGRIICGVDSLPTSIPTTFARFKLSSLTFKSGLGPDDLKAFCELASSRPDSEAGRDPQKFLEGRGVVNVILNEAVYAKVGEEALLQALEQKSLEETIRALVGNAVADPKKQKMVYEKVENLVREDIQRRIDEVTRPLVREKTALQNETSRTKGVMENVADGVIVVDDGGNILMMNPAAEQLYSAPLSQVAGQHLAAKAGAEHLVTLAQEIATPADRAIKQGVESVGADEAKKTMKAAAAVVQNEAGNIVGIVSSLHDTAKLRELERMQREFVAHVTHELRAPLTAIRAALDILNEEFRGRVSDEETRIMGSALHNTDRLERLINDILDFSKIEAGEMRVNVKKSDAERIAREAVDGLRPWAQRKGIDLSLDAEPDLPPIMADSHRTVQVLVNLLSNAIKFTPAKGRVTVKVFRPKDGEKIIELTVADTGPGIPASEHKRIFEKFIQIATGEVRGGTGLGLAIAKAITHMQNGRLWLESQEGKGSTFYIALPLWAGPAEEGGAKPAGAEKTVPDQLPWWKKLLGLK